MFTRRSVITVGNFDGMHRGHRALLDAARRQAGEAGAEVAAVTFQTHPLAVLRPERAPRVLTDVGQRTVNLLDAGADRIEWLRPDPEVLGLSPDRFVQRMVERCRPVGWVEGPDFRFGKGAAGDVRLLKEMGEEMGFQVRVIDPVQVTLRDKTRCTVRSSLVRWLVAMGRMADAAVCLGRPYAIRGEVVEGEQRGREIGFPTANVAADHYQLPADGVYAAAVELDGAEHAAAVSVGTKPTFGEKRRAFEAYLLDYDGDLYGRTIEVKMMRWLRDQSPFPSVDTLIEQMDRDVRRVRRLHGEGLGT